MRKLRFCAIFLLAFAALLIVWQHARAADWYTRGVLAVAGTIGPLTHGWVLETPATAAPAWVKGDRRVQLAIQFDALTVGLVPLLALLTATPGLRLRRRGLLMMVGGVANLFVDAIIVTLFPLLVYYKNPFTDVLGTFLGVITFVGAPVIIWFALTYHELRTFLPSLRRPPAR